MTRSRELAELASAYDSGSSLGMRNRIINGDMRIDQRNAGASVTAISTSDLFAVDRFGAQCSVSSKYSAQRVTDAPAGFTNSLKITSLSAYSVGVSDYFSVFHRIEGNNVADFGFGTASAQNFTISFWAKSSLTGTFGGSLRGAGYTRGYAFTYTISAANTWEYKTVTVAGDTTGAWLTDSGTGIQVAFALGAGSNFSTAAGSWQTAAIISATGATSVVGTNGATFYITGVQLEAGSVATPFERRDYGRELQMCQRYYEKSGGSGNAILWSGNTTSAYAYFYSIVFTVQKRATPACGVVGTPANNGFPNTINMDSASLTGVRAYETANATVSGAYLRGDWVAIAEL